MAEPRRRSRIVKALLGLLIALLLLEVVLRFCPVSTGLRPQRVDAEHPVYRFEPSHAFTFSRGWNFDLANDGWVNRDGFVNDQDYLEKDAQPLLAIVGDSFIEAQMVPYAETVHGRLAKKHEGRLRIYSFAAAAAPLSQYLVWARHARENFTPDALVISIVGNDFDESLAKYAVAAGQHHFVPSASGRLELQRFDFSSSRLGRVVHASALARYLHLNLKLGNRLKALLGRLKGQKTAEERFVGNTATAYTPERLADSLAAIDRFFELLPEWSGMGPERILFVVDGMRPDLYDPATLEQARTSYFAVMRSSFVAKAKSLSYEVIDLQERFVERYRRDHERFEFATDYHWNGTGHGVVAEAVESSQLFQSFQRLSRHGMPILR